MQLLSNYLPFVLAQYHGDELYEQHTKEEKKLEKEDQKRRKLEKKLKKEKSKLAWSAAPVVASTTAPPTDPTGLARDI